MSWRFFQIVMQSMMFGLLAAILVPSLILGLVLRRPVIRLNRWVLAKLDGTKFL